MLKAAFAVVIALAPTAPAFAADEVPAAPSCLTYENAKAIGEDRASAEHNTKFMDFGGEDATALIKAINATPPESDLAAERVLVLERPDLDEVKLALIVAGCVTHAAVTSEQEWRRVKTQALVESRS